MLVSNHDFAKISHLIDNKNAYSRLLQYESQFDVNLTELKDNSLIAYLGLWVYAEYFSQYPADLDAGRLETLKELLKALRDTPFHNGVHDYEMFYGKESNVAKCLPLLSAQAWDFLHQHCDEIVYWVKEDDKIDASPAGKARWAACTSPEEVMAFWTMAIQNPKIFSNAADPLDMHDVGKMGLNGIFNRVFLGAPGIASLLLTVKGQLLWRALHTSEYNVSSLRRIFLRQLIEQVDPENLQKILTQYIYEDKSEYAQRSFIDLAMVLDVEQLTKFMSSSQEAQKMGTALIVAKLQPESTFDNEDKHILLKQTGSLLSREQLEELAHQYAQSDWVMLRAIKREAVTNKVMPTPNQFFDKLERDSYQKYKGNWPAYVGPLERLLLQIEASLKSSEPSQLYKRLQTVSSYVAPALPNKLTAAITDHFDSITPAMKDLYALHTPEGIVLSDQSYPPSTSSLTLLFIGQYKEDYPNATHITLNDLPTFIQDRIDVLRPQLAAAAGVKSTEEKGQELKLV